jgi:hypothetical protein
MSDTLDAVLRAAGLPVPVREYRFAPPLRRRFPLPGPEQLPAP